ncbi:hypothetical protein GUJ93_ZPchr0007g5767 [Zizania palustris]|uniref:Uncharacterized protein n=1 Tax=Zizania palustris TaxID=103762 RepID=A0A8J5T2F2_ZIZPA|nr:hypothetical protein GUJ93_ZPchr0007g5767 [Zizania palustris]KAG8077309.1 hypothetical protein GUJ93_ZPchr0007g5767 [Zizania palustris]
MAGLCGGADGTQQGEIDVWPEFQNLAGDVISRAAFGSSFSEGRRIFELQSEQARNVVQMASTMYIPGYSLLPTKLNRRTKANAREVEELLRGVITKREREMKDGHGDKDDLIGLLLESNIEENQETGSSKPTMTTEDIIGELKLFYFAGMETTAVLLTWTMVVLSMHPEWQDRAREEVLRVFGKNVPDVNGINRLKTVSATSVVKGVSRAVTSRLAPRGAWAPGAAQSHQTRQQCSAPADRAAPENRGQSGAAGDQERRRRPEHDCTRPPDGRRPGAPPEAGARLHEAAGRPETRSAAGGRSTTARGRRTAEVIAREGRWPDRGAREAGVDTKARRRPKWRTAARRRGGEAATRAAA